MKKFLFTLLALMSASMLDARLVTFINKTSSRLGITTIDFPFRRSDVSDVSLTWLAPGRQINYTTDDRLVGWYQPGMPVNYSVLDRQDEVIVFVEFADQIKTLHGQPRLMTYPNYDSYNPVMVETKNPKRGEEDCHDCAEDCYYRYSSVTSRNCPCLNWCWDKTRDMKWIVNPGRTLEMLVAAGTKLGLSELY